MKYGFTNDYTGACLKLKILDETISGKYVCLLDNRIILIDKNKVTDISEE